MISLAALVSVFGTGALTVTRRAAGTRSGGFYTPGSSSTVTFDPAVVHPITGRELRALPEGYRTREPIAVYTTAALRTASEPDGTPPDLVTWKGETYEVQAVEDWSSNGAFWRAVALKVATS